MLLCSRPAVATPALVSLWVLVFCPNSSPAQPIPVEIRRENDRYVLLRAGQPYFIKGVVYGGEPRGRLPLSEVRSAGANSVRVGSRNLAPLLEEAHRLGLTVTVGLPMSMEWADKFDYSDSVAVSNQLRRVQEVVLRHKDAPAVLMWSLGNELSTFYTNRAVWKAVNDAAEWIHRVDPHHPVMTVLGDSPGFLPTIREVRELSPALDLLGFNVYGQIEKIPGVVREAGWDKPYCFMEWGPSGHWQVAKTSWKAPIEESSARKAELYQQRYEHVIARDPERCAGSYAFYWNWKQEITFTWYGLFLPTGERLPPLDALTRVWTGHWPTNRGPAVRAPEIDTRKGTDNIVLSPGSVHRAEVEASDPEHDPLRFEWLILPEVVGGGYAGRGERKPEPVPGLFPSPANSGTTSETEFRAPSEPGAYRLFVIVRDGHGSAGVGNVPFRVE